MKNILLSTFALLMLTGNGIAQNLPSYVPANGLVGWWPFNGNANDESGYGRNGTVYSSNNTVQYLNGIDGLSVYLKGSGHVGINGDHILIPPVGFHNFSSYTISLWVKHDGSTALYGHDESFISGRRASDPCYGTFGMGFAEYYPNCIIGYSNSYTGVGQSSYTGMAGKWTMHTMVVENGTIKGYKNDSLFQTSTGPNQATSEESVIGIGTHWFCSGGTQSTRFIGGIDNLGMWNRALSQEEITQLFNNNVSSLNPGFAANSPAIRIWPNPARGKVALDAGNTALTQGLKYKVANTLGQTVVNETLINQQQTLIDLSTWGGNGIYYLHLINPQGHAIEIKKIILAP